MDDRPTPTAISEHSKTNSVQPAETQPPSVLKFAQLTDIHLDPAYAKGASTQCGKTVCCRTGDDLVNSVGSQIASSNVPLRQAAGKFGDFKCDCPPILLQSAIDEIMKQQPKFVLWTGDNPSHHVWEQSRSYNLNVTMSIGTILENSRQKFSPATQIIPCVGNHDIFPSDMFQQDTALDGWFYESLAHSWRKWLPQDAIDTFKRVGYYKLTVSPGFAAVVVNTNLWIEQDLYRIVASPIRQAHDDQIQWFHDELDKSAKLGEKVLVVGHMPPGHRDQSNELSGALNMIVEKFNNTIVGQVFGHTHQDSFKVYLDTQIGSEPVSVAYVAPPLTPFNNRNPRTPSPMINFEGGW
eukprot:c12724_g1_i2.p1 GENE.c12724_g1_i2~~c12724_g1_i2.p1  ORF type:complete len:352 (+),score=75.08 c12724_g1_i2:168-1223(+)